MARISHIWVAINRCTIRLACFSPMDQGTQVAAIPQIQTQTETRQMEETGTRSQERKAAEKERKIKERKRKEKDQRKEQAVCSNGRCSG